MSKSVYLDSKPRYEILDGLRGVAALMVICFHMFETYFSSSPDQPINHGYLAVDFFFVLSGFVVGYAYNDRWDRMTTWNFFKRRFVRLHPMIIAASVFGALMFYFGDCSTFPLVNQTPWWQVALYCLLGMLMIPVSPSADIRGWEEIYPLNSPQWTMAWEYIANILYAYVFRHFSKTALAIAAALSALLTINLALNIDVGGILVPRNWAIYSVAGGWSTTPEQLLIGDSRLFYPFLIGLLISRLNLLTRIKSGFWWCSLIVIAALGMPHMNGHVRAIEDGIYQVAAILIVFPLVVSMGAGSNVTGKSAKLCRWLGRISYPIYIIHYPLIYMQMSWAEKHKDLPLGVHIAVAVSLFILAIGIAHALLTIYDEPVREWLKDHWLHRKTSQKQ